MVDTSGSMGLGGSGGQMTNSCGMAPSRINAAKCALNQILSSYPEADYGLGRFQMECDGDDTYKSYCLDPGDDPDTGEMLVPIGSDNLNELISYVDFSPDYTDPTELSCPEEDPPEILVNDSNEGNTPLEGTLLGAQRYYAGNDPDFGTSPIEDDPFFGCRPYYVLLLTDGDETCDGDPPSAATALRATDVPGVGEVDINTYVIGFGVPDQDQNVVDIATAGGTTALFAQNEDELVQRFSQIIEDSLVSEECNNDDDDCDDKIDEGFQKFCDIDGELGPPTANLELCIDPLDDCDGEDDNCFQGIQDEPVNDCGFCGPEPDEECNNLDDDCDGDTDEDDVCGNCIFQGAELCNGEDEDCDGDIDEGLVRQCGTDVGDCDFGHQTCEDGEWLPEECDDGREEEACNGEDDDCDGTIDGFAEECFNPPNAPPFHGVCQPGIMVCPSDGSGEFGDCLGEVGPSDEACDGEDDDCDNDVDEDTGGADCSSDCGIGETVCVDGELECSAGPQMPEPETCNNFDDDCDDIVDEDIPSGGECDEGGTLCIPGELQCLGGEMVCVGGEHPGIEICDCEDNDCDDEVDEEPPQLCPNGTQCVSCQCASPCGEDEFPCPQGFVCIDEFCLVDHCYQVDCPPLDNGELQTCLEGECVPLCDTVECPEGLVCNPANGSCFLDDCIAFPDKCTEDELCVGGTCQADPCADVTCSDNDEYCYEGECVGTCAAVPCPAGQKCEFGECVPDRCLDVDCGDTEVCDEDSGDCIEDLCESQCRAGQLCDPETGECEKDPCLGVDCPGEQICVDGSCFNQSDFAPDGGVIDHQWVSAGGGGGCSAAGGGGWRGALLLLAFLSLVTIARWWRRGRRALLAAALAALPLAATGCHSDGFCLDCLQAFGDGGPPDDGQGADYDGGPNDDGGPPADACTTSGIEQCDGIDNDCDGEVDNGDLPGVGNECNTEYDGIGECVAGTTECVLGEIECRGDAVLPVQESCDDLDNDCDDEVDEGNPGGGLVCGTNQGECSAGVTSCVDGEIECPDKIDGTAEECDGLDNDCDGDFDEDVLTGGPCGPDNEVGLCEIGTLACIGGQMQCEDAIMPQVEICDGLNQDCDDEVDEDFDFDNNAQHCGGCNQACSAPNAIAICDGTGGCAIGACLQDYWDLPPFDYDDGCEYGPCEFQGAEACGDPDGDGNPDEDCDDDVDEDLVAPDICDPDGACAGADPECDEVASEWVCTYGPDVELDGSGNIVPETRCDGIDNDCDGDIDESFPLLGQPCDDGDDGICRDEGEYICNDAGDGVECDAQDVGDPPVPPAETCNNKDDDCDGNTDEGEVDVWVDLGGVEIYAYEASRPDATNAAAGGLETRSCSRADARPWTNVTYLEAQAACDAAGARLCEEDEWQLACELAAPNPPSPTPQDPGDNGIVYVEAEDYDAIDDGDTSDDWVLRTNIAGYSGSGFMYGTSDNGSNRDPQDSPELGFEIDFEHTGIHYIWIRGYAHDGNADKVHAGLDGDWTSGGPTDEIGPWVTQDEWLWVGYNEDGVRATVDVPSTGVHTVNIWMREDGFRIDKILLTTNPGYFPQGFGPTGECDWSFASDCRTYQENTCNGEDFDPSGAAGDQDLVQPTGEMDMCYADWGAAGHVFDLSGNVKEWTEARTDGENPIRGGAYGSTANGMRCDNDFLVADDDFLFPNVGFRCCR